MERNTVNLVSIESQYSEYWWYEAYCLTTRHIWDILIMQLGKRHPRPGMFSWRCCCPGFPTGSGTVQGHDEAREQALAYVLEHDHRHDVHC